MKEQPEALWLADALEGRATRAWTREQVAARLRRLHALVAACEPYLKEGETPAERIERERLDTEAVCRLYAKEREKNVKLLEALRPFASATLTDGGAIVGLMREDFERARAAIAKAEGEKE
jgi:hypothetical protein